jgi:hypothetical protein
MNMDRDEIYRELASRLERMRYSEESETFERGEVRLYERLSALTDAVHHDLITINAAKRKLDDFIDELKQAIRF